MNNYELTLLLQMLVTCASKNWRLICSYWLTLLFMCCVLESSSHSSVTCQSSPQCGRKKTKRWVTAEQGGRVEEEGEEDVEEGGKRSSEDETSALDMTGQSWCDGGRGISGRWEAQREKGREREKEHSEEEEAAGCWPGLSASRSKQTANTELASA